MSRCSLLAWAAAVCLAASTAVAPSEAFAVVTPSLKRRILSAARVRTSSLHLAAEEDGPGVADNDDSSADKKKATTTFEAKAAVPSTPVAPAAPASTTSTTVTAAAAADPDPSADSLLAELQEVGQCASLLFGYVMRGDDSVTAEDVVGICDEIDAIPTAGAERNDLQVNKVADLRGRTLRASRYELLNKLMRKDYDAYVATASFLSPSRIPRDELPNVQDVPMEEGAGKAAAAAAAVADEDGLPLVADCTLESKKFDDNLLDKLLLKIFRNLVEKNTGGITSPKDGIEGLLEQGRTYMLKPGQTAEAQHKMVYDTLGGLMTPALPPFYRIFMSGIVPQIGTEYDGKQLGPWFYAPWLTSVVTPTFFGFLVGPSRPNSRKDGRPGGLVVEKCKFLQESGCKGLCLNQCKLPAQQFFQEKLGLPLTVSPNFVTQECQWSFGEVPLPPEDDPSFPRGCLVGCPSREAMKGSYADALG